MEWKECKSRHSYHGKAFKKGQQSKNNFSVLKRKHASMKHTVHNSIWMKEHIEFNKKKKCIIWLHFKSEKVFKKLKYLILHFCTCIDFALGALHKHWHHVLCIWFGSRLLALMWPYCLANILYVSTAGLVWYGTSSCTKVVSRVECRDTQHNKVTVLDWPPYCG